MLFFYFPLLNASYVKLKQTVSFKTISLPGWSSEGFVLGVAGEWGGGFCVGGLVGGGGGGGGGGVRGGMFCIVLSEQSRLAEEHFWLKRLCWYDRVVSAGESVMDFEKTEMVLCNDTVY